MPSKINSREEFLEAIKQQNVVIDCYADWCMPCKMLGQVIDELEPSMNNIKFYKLNVDEFDDLVPGINSIPCLVLVNNGVELTRIIGFRSLETLQEELQKVFK